MALVATVPTDSPPQDSGVNAESSGSQKEKSDSPSQKAGQVGKSDSHSFENKPTTKEKQRTQILQKTEERQEKTKRKAVI